MHVCSMQITLPTVHDRYLRRPCIKFLFGACGISMGHKECHKFLFHQCALEYYLYHGAMREQARGEAERMALLTRTVPDLPAYSTPVPKFPDPLAPEGFHQAVTTGMHSMRVMHSNFWYHFSKTCRCTPEMALN